ncbi:unnamed protein product [Cylindrotheca closterium]|uniref:Uncharacterized protein n=1 Tax=Cylindrotheca closterium TaxID=2856 RepID=A0AAD2CDP8_9STRA|nr:unnamed protein product [Cylindrotheca closterium]
MFFCNPFHQTNNNREEGDDGDTGFRFLIDHDNFSSWEPSNDSPNLEPTASFSTGSAGSTYDRSEDSSFANGMFHDASSDAIFRQRIPHPSDQPTRRRLTTRWINVTRFSKLMILLRCVALGVFLLGWPYYTYYNKESMKDNTLWIKGALRIWNGAVPSSSKLIEISGASIGILGKIPWAISSLFQWDCVDDAIIHWTKGSILIVPKAILESGRVAATATHATLPLILETATKTVARPILRTIDEFAGPAPGAQQALALLDFLQDADL